MKKRFLLPAMMLAAAFASCNNEDVAPVASRATLGVDVSVNELSRSRAMVYGTKLADGAEIGISVVESDGSNYDDNSTGYLNIPYVATGEDASQTWAASGSEILLSGTEGKAIAYFPYDENIQNFDYTAIPVDIAEQTDWMWAAPTTVLTDAAPNVSFSMEHAQTAVNVKVVRDASYTGVGVISALTVTSEGLAQTGELNATNGTFAEIDGANEAVSIAGTFNLTESDGDDSNGIENEKENPYMFIPATAETKPFTIAATIDGKSYTVEVNMNEAFTAGKVYKISVKISNVGLTVDGVVILEDWTPENLAEGTLAPAP